MRSRRCHTTAIAVSVLILAGCTGDDEWPEGLTDIRDTDATDPDEPNEPDEPDPAGEADEPDQSDDDPEDTDVEDPEPDEADEDGITVSGVFVPDDAFEINDEIDLDEQTQLDHLQFVLDAYLYTTQALNTGEWDPDAVAGYYAGEELEENLAGHERYDRDGLRQVNDGTVVDRLRIERFDSSGIVVHYCITRGQDDGVIDVESGEYTFQTDRRIRSLASLLALVEVADSIEWRILQIWGEPDELCE